MVGKRTLSAYVQNLRFDDRLIITTEHKLGEVKTTPYAVYTNPLSKMFYVKDISYAGSYIRIIIE